MDDYNVSDLIVKLGFENEAALGILFGFFNRFLTNTQADDLTFPRLHRLTRSICGQADFITQTNSAGGDQTTVDDLIIERESL